MKPVTEFPNWNEAAWLASAPDGFERTGQVLVGRFATRAGRFTGAIGIEEDEACAVVVLPPKWLKTRGDKFFGALPLPSPCATSREFAASAVTEIERRWQVAGMPRPNGATTAMDLRETIRSSSGVDPIVVERIEERGATPPNGGRPLLREEGAGAQSPPPRPAPLPEMNRNEQKQSQGARVMDTTTIKNVDVQVNPAEMVRATGEVMQGQVFVQPALPMTPMTELACRYAEHQLELERRFATIIETMINRFGEDFARQQAFHAKAGRPLVWLTLGLAGPRVAMNASNRAIYDARRLLYDMELVLSKHMTQLLQSAAQTRMMFAQVIAQAFGPYVTPGTAPANVLDIAQRLLQSTANGAP